MRHRKRRALHGPDQHTTAPTDREPGRKVEPMVVNALLRLRGISMTQLAALTGLSGNALRLWLLDSAAPDDRLPLRRQVEVLTLLGVDGASPRPDVVHPWVIQEPAFGDRTTAYQDLRTALLTFGSCSIAPITASTDPAFSFRHSTFFGLSFDTFKVVLEVRAAPFRSLAFAPEQFPGLRWEGYSAPLVVPDETFRRLTTPGEAPPGALDQAWLLAIGPASWHKLISLATERGIGANQIARRLLELPSAQTHEHA